MHYVTLFIERKSYVFSVIEKSVNLISKVFGQYITICRLEISYNESKFCVALIVEVVAKLRYYVLTNFSCLVEISFGQLLNYLTMSVTFQLF